MKPSSVEWMRKANHPAHKHHTESQRGKAECLNVIRWP